MRESVFGSVCGHNKDNDPLLATYTTYCRDYPNNFMQDESCVQAVNEAIEHLEGAENNQHEVDVVYDDFCSTVKCEMDRKLEHKIVSLQTGLNNKRRRIKKPWWHDGLTVLWNEFCTAEDVWHKAAVTRRQKRKAVMRKAQKSFDKQVQSAKRKYWWQTQEELLNLSTDNSNAFWEKIGKIGIGEKRSNIPWELVDGNTVYKDPKVVLNKWANEFENLLNPAPVITAGYKHQSTNSAGSLLVIHILKLTYLEINKVVTSMKLGKAVGVDELPIEALKSECV